MTYNVRSVENAISERYSLIKKSILCYVCKKALFLKYATDTKDGVNDKGIGRLAYEPFVHNEEVEELNKVFG